MSTSFTALMALSASQTKENQRMVQDTLAERRRREEEKRKELERKERIEKEREAKMRLKKLEEQNREKERQEKLLKERRAKEEELRRREEEQRMALMYGPKKSKLEYPSSNSASRDELRRQRLPSPDESSGPSALTREEKRQRKLAMELRRSYGNSKRSSHGSGYGKAGRVLPGGAIDMTTASPSSSGSGSHQSVKARLAAIPNTLTKLNVNKRDTRTIDEILQDRAKEREAKVLAGDQAREFNDWFGTSKKKEKEKATTRSATPLTWSNTPSQARSTKSASPGLFSDSGSASAPAKKSAAGKGSPAPGSLAKTIGIAATKSAAASKASANRLTPLDMKSLPSMRSTAGSGKTPTSAVKVTSSTKLSASSAAASKHPASSTGLKKRPRSPSYTPSPSPPPSNKKRALSSGPTRGASDLSSEIWKIFGKDRSSYMDRAVYSDDEDMEVDARFLEREEARSARIARKEDDLALQEEMRREEEKRRRRKEREARERVMGKA
ncbi:hypothetical protein OE88DRAFT_1739738 [Heliocybe sulcata]|uniref:SPT2-domain-containing protein n=1 Tax=Heliocybe sulcata TaxID=5364 RepID=A0A5C3MMG0_9AGAM|nr:hypothetical protein OE88DRAFT_1739738 [Heliocybe sulcata]